MPHTRRDDDRRCIRRYLAGELDAIEEITRWIDADLSACLIRRHADREDLRQAVHHKLLRNLRNNAYRQDASLRRYVSRIARFTTVDLYRRALLRIALAQCPAGCREMLHMVARQRLNYEQVARRLGIPLGTVKSRMWHCRRRLIQGMQRAAAASSRAALTRIAKERYAVNNPARRLRQRAVAPSRLRLPKWPPSVRWTKTISLGKRMSMAWGRLAIPRSKSSR